MARARLGVALLVPAPLDREVDGLRRALGDTSLGRIPAHLTLVPPVNVRVEDRACALDVLASAGARTRAFAVCLGPVATFGPDSPVVYLAVGSGGDEVGALRERVRRGPLERRVGWPYVAHVTLADEATPARVDAAVAALADWRVRSASIGSTCWRRAGAGCGSRWPRWRWVPRRSWGRVACRSSWR